VSQQLPSKCQALSSIPSTVKKKKKWQINRSAPTPHPPAEPEAPQAARVVCGLYREAWVLGGWQRATSLDGTACDWTFLLLISSSAHKPNTSDAR
jgi:hypothetical protein